MLYGDSSTGSNATGPIGLETVQLAGISLKNQAFVAVNDTDNVSVQDGAAGIIGLGFPTERCAHNEKFILSLTFHSVVQQTLVSGSVSHFKDRKSVV